MNDDDKYVILRRDKTKEIRNEFFLSLKGWVVDKEFALKFTEKQANGIRDAMFFVAQKNLLNNLEFIVEKS